MSLRSVLAEKRSMYELIPVIENWLIENGYILTTIANRIDAEGKGITARLFFEDYSSGCLVKVVSNEQFFMELKAFLSNQQLLSYRISCSYCGRTFESSKGSCPYCSAPKGNIKK
jgi:rRNA maturation endonuclease Nob1